MDLDRGKGTKSRFVTKSKVGPQTAAKTAPGGRLDGGCEVVPLHGDLAVLRCTFCQKTCGWEDRGKEDTLLKGQAPECLSCALSDQQRRDRGKRGTKIGSLRPNVVLYGEEHPAADAVGSITTHDLSLGPDILLVLGTSLHVKGVKTLVKEFARCVHARPRAKGKVIFVNLSKPCESSWNDSIDYWVSMDCDEWIGALRRHRPDIWHLQTQLETHITKKDVQRPPKVSTSSKPKAAVSEDKENGVAEIQKVIHKPHQRLATRISASALAEVKNNVVHRIIVEDSEAESCDDSVEDLNSSQLPTPPPSNHKQSSPAQRRRSNGPLGEHPKTPTKEARLPARPKHEPPPLKRSRFADDTPDEYSPPKRKRLDIRIWED